MTRTALACERCGSRIGVDDRFCESCGAPLDEGGITATGSDRTATDLHVVAGVSDRGLVHPTNEDAYFVDVVEGTVLGVVCDGVSSSTAGGVAARVAADAAGAVLTTNATHAMHAMHDAERAIVHAVAAARDAVAAVAWAPMRSAAAPSTTIVAATVAAGVITVAGVGDSRAYWIDAVEAHQLTRDDSWVEEQVASGRLRADDAMLDPRAHMITAWLGADAPDRAPTVVSFRPERHGVLLLCSDGLWNSWPEAAELAALVHGIGAERTIDVAQALVDRAVAAGGRDNITVVAVDVTSHVDGSVA